MKIVHTHAAVLVGIMTVCAGPGARSPPRGPVLSGAEQKKVSYALGMDLGLQIKRLGANVDVKTIIQALKDVQEDRPTQLKESEVRTIFRREEVADRARQSVKNLAQGRAFLEKNSSANGVTVLPDGLQYQVLQAGAGETPKASDSVVVNYKGTLIDGAEFDHKDNFEIPVAAPVKGWQEALLRMKTGSKWRLFVPSALAYGHRAMGAVGPDSTLIFDIELVSVKPPPPEK